MSREGALMGSPPAFVSPRASSGDLSGFRIQRRAVTNGERFREWGFIRSPEYFSATAAATRAAFGR
jgi:hypothetical protein